MSSSTVSGTVSESVERLAEQAALDFSDAFDVPVDHPEDEGLREDFAGSLTRRVEEAISDTQLEFAERAKRLAEGRPS